MNTHAIDLAALAPHGQVVSEVRDGILRMTVLRANSLHHCKPGIKCSHYMELPGRYRLPLRIDMTVKLDAPALFLMLGGGHASFGCHWSDNRRLEDICEPRQKTAFFDGYIPLNEWAGISLLYDLDEMQILIDGEERYYSKRERYMKSPLLEQMNQEGFPCKITCAKRTELDIRSITVTEYDDTAGVIRAPAQPAERPVGQGGHITPAGKPTFESCIANLPQEIKDTIIDLDGWLRALRPVKFRRQIEKNGNKITYIASDEGFSYAIHPSYDVLYHTLQWYILTQGKPETWGRKANRMEETLNHLAETDPAFARRMFDNLYECTGGYGAGCLAATPYTFDREKKVACHGKMWFKMNLSEFEDVRRFIGAVNELKRL